MQNQEKEADQKTKRGGKIGNKGGTGRPKILDKKVQVALILSRQTADELNRQARIAKEKRSPFVEKILKKSFNMD